MNKEYSHFPNLPTSKNPRRNSGNRKNPEKNRLDIRTNKFFELHLLETDFCILNILLPSLDFSFCNLHS